MKYRTIIGIFAAFCLLTVWQTIVGGVSPNSASAWIIVISFLAFVVKYLIATYVYKTNKSSRVNQYFALDSWMFCRRCSSNHYHCSHFCSDCCKAGHRSLTLWNCLCDQPLYWANYTPHGANTFCRVRNCQHLA